MAARSRATEISPAGAAAAERRPDSGVHPGLARALGEHPAAVEAEIVRLVLRSRQALRRTYAAARGATGWDGIDAELAAAAEHLAAARERVAALAASDEAETPRASER